MNPTDGFEATFRVRIDRPSAWERLTNGEPRAAGDRLWLAGFDADVTLDEVDVPRRLRATKVDEPCSGTDIVLTLEDDDTGTRIHVVQSGFDAWLPGGYELMAVGWRHIVADLQTFVATGLHARRHLRPWGDLGADTVAEDGGIRIGEVRGGLAERLGLATGDLLVALAGAPTASLDDLVTVLRVLDSTGADPAAEWIRAGDLVTTGPAGAPA